MLQIYIGTPEEDQYVTVPKDWTVSKMLSEHNVSVNGLIQHNGNNVRNLEKTLEELGVKNDDQIYVVRKMDSAK